MDFYLIVLGLDEKASEMTEANHLKMSIS